MSKKRYKTTPPEALKRMSNAELVNGFEYACISICNAHNFTRYGPTKAMHEEREAFGIEILRRMSKTATREDKHRG